MAEVDRRRVARVPPIVKSGRRSMFGSSSSVQAAGERRSVGSRIAGAKLRDRWRASGSQDLARTCRGKALRAAKAVLIDEGTVAAVLALLLCDSSQRGRRDMGRQRRYSRALHAADNAAAGRCPRLVTPATRTMRSASRRIAEAGGAPSSATSNRGPSPLQSGLGAGRTVSRPLLQVKDGVSRPPGRRTDCGCSCWSSVAEVGEEHLALRHRAERRRLS